jgi:hypothetical protein
MRWPWQKDEVDEHEADPEQLHKLETIADRLETVTSLLSQKVEELKAQRAAERAQGGATS